MTEFVYVQYDPLYEKPICVHAKENELCAKCFPITEEKRTAYQLEEIKLPVTTQFFK